MRQSETSTPQKGLLDIDGHEWWIRQFLERESVQAGWVQHVVVRAAATGSQGWLLRQRETSAEALGWAMGTSTRIER